MGGFGFKSFETLGSTVRELIRYSRIYSVNNFIQIEFNMLNEVKINSRNAQSSLADIKLALPLTLTAYLSLITLNKFSA